MKLKTLIPVIVTIAAVLSVIAIVSNEYYNQEPIILVDDSINLCPICDDSDETLHEVLRHCQRQSAGEYQTYEVISFMNSTHHIDNILCEWHTNEHPLNPMHPDYETK